MPKPKQKPSNQLVSKAGLFYVCYELSKRGWNCSPTTRNAKIVISNSKGDKKYTIQVKSLSKQNPVPFGSKLEIMADFVIVCTEVFSEKPNLYILKPQEVKERIHKGEKNNKISYWLQPKSYLDCKDRWGKIGNGY